jgi:serine-type D-Ala-D-Ala carboxypeptidase (penicillin-binding protein 5/6)
VSCFIAEMNKNCCSLQLRSSFFDSPHGLMNRLNRSTAFDIAKLSSICMGDPRFVKIVSCSKYVVPKAISGNKRTYTWENTHKLIGPGCNGIKTGITNSAGPCLAT